MNLSTLESVLLVLLVADALALATLVLMQHGKGADVGAAFGSGGANTVFGSAGSASFLTRTTVWLAVGFFLISFGLAYTAKERAATIDSLGIPQVEQTDPPAAPGDRPSAGEDSPDPAGERLTTEPEGVDSDIPDV